MLVLLVFYLHSLLSPALGQTIIEAADNPSFVPDSEGDLFFLLDSSGSVTYDEFSKIKKFIGDLLQPFKFGPQDVQASVVQISTDPTLEFPLNQYSSSKDVQNAIQKMTQRQGDTNTGKAIDFVKKNLYVEDFGSRRDVPKVLVWVTDGLSTDDISWPMKLLKDMGVSVFIISTTGRGNFQELSAAASEPNEKFLKFVDKDDLGIITKELRDSIIELIKAKRLHALNITTTSFLLTWPKLLSKEIGHYVLKYAPVADPKKIQHTLHGDQTSLEITGLTANTTYEVTLYPESNIEYLQPQTIKVSTLQEAKEERNLEALNITTTDFVLTWTRLFGDTGMYVIEYSPLSDPKSKLQKTTSVEETSVVLSALTPNTTYQVTLIPDSNDPNIQPETIEVSTIPDYIQARNLQLLGITATSFNVSWSRLMGDMGRYFLDYALLSYPRRKTRKTLYGDQTTAMVSGLIPNTTYQVTFIPESKLEVSQSQMFPVSTLPDHTSQSRNFHARDITSTGFLLTWTRLPGDEGHYVLEYVEVSDPGMTQQKIVHGDKTSVAVSGLKSGATYQITLIPEHSTKSAPPEVIMVSTHSELVQPRNFQAINVTATSFLLTWSRAPGDWGRYIVEYSPVSDPTGTLQKTLSGDVNSALISNLTPDTTYQVSLTHESGVQYGRIRVSTAIEQVQPRNFQAINVTVTSFVLTWSGAPGDWGRYIVEYSPVSDPMGTLQKTLSGDVNSALISNLTPDTTYQVSLTHESGVQYGTIQVSTPIEQVQPRNFQAINVTATSFVLTWSGAPGDWGRYIVEYSPVSDPRGTLQKTLSGDVNSVLISNLTPDTTYQVSLTHESGVQYGRIQVSTPIELVQPRNFQAINVTATSFLLTWSKAPGDWGRYIVEYSPVSNPRGTLQKTLSGDVNSMLISNLSPNTTYQVSLTHESGVQYGTIQVSTPIDLIKARNLHVRDRTSNSFQLSWSKLPGDTGRYVLQYAPLKDLSKIIQNILYGDQTSMIFTNLAPDTVYQVTFSPDSKGPVNQVQNIRISTLPELDQKRLVYTRDITTSSLQLGWSRMPGDHGPYIVEFELVSNPRRKLRKTLPFDETNIIFSNLSPNTEYRAVVFSESNIQHVPPQSIHISTLEEQLSPAHILISDPSVHSFRVSWGPSLDSIAGYEIQYSPMASNIVQTLQVDSRVNSTVLENLKPNTTYLVTVSAIFKSGGEKSLSAIACTEHNDTKVKFLHFKDLGSNSVKATWGSADGEVQGYRVRCRRQAGRSSVISVAPQTHSVYLTDVAEGATNKICVVPIYKDGEGKNLCRKISIRPGTSANSYSRISTR
ncbi:von Willebrand factor A domain-containing protein 1 [Anomaloglossus baeobatrachus]|uniref:von Willebrand factor A domain-containing protein 1 n=1 Tax=Anomaloglossus baeobatrachus TaxID=238106 RepID=UPI003F4F45A6